MKTVVRIAIVLGLLALGGLVVARILAREEPSAPAMPEPGETKAEELAEASA